MIATQNTGQGMLPLLQLLGGGSLQNLDDLKGLKGLEGGLQGLKGEGADSFLAVLEPQMEALLANLGVPADELEGLDLEAMLARLEDLLDGQEFAGQPEDEGKALPLATLMAAVAEPGTAASGRGEPAAAGRSGADAPSLPVKPLPAAVMRLFVEASQAAAGRDGAANLKPDMLGNPAHLGRDNLLDVLTQWVTQSGDDARRGRTDPLSGVMPSLAGQSEASEAARSLPRLDLTRLLQQPNGARELADQVRMLAQAQGGRTELKLHPPQLGSLDVRVLVEGDRTSIQFISANPVTREVLEAAMPRLRDSLAESGLMLEDATVSDQAAEEKAEQGAQQAMAQADAELDDDPQQETEGSTLSMLNRRLDLFA